jgi:outer membrane protein TolC
MGEAPGLLDAGAQAIPAAPQPAPGLPVDALRRRPDVALAETALHEATALIGVEEAELYPRFSLSSGVHASVGSPGDLLTGSSYTVSAGPQMRWRVFDRARIKQRVAAAGANAEAALNTFDATVLNALGEVENALAAVSHGAERVARLETAERASRQSAGAARALYEKGAGGLEAVLTEQQRLLAVQDALAEARTRWALAGVALYQALGGGWEEPEKAVEKQKKAQ